MRTTVNLDDDVLAAARERARREGRNLGEVISELVRAALTGEAPDGYGEQFHGFRPLPSRGRLVSNAVIDKLREDESE
ncbi:MAG: ribbon-helix-helix protein, CopG family [Acidimicrobiales bacterium]